VLDGLSHCICLCTSCNWVVGNSFTWFNVGGIQTFGSNGYMTSVVGSNPKLCYCGAAATFYYHAASKWLIWGQVSA
jgi:hypothetical protein